MFIKKFNSLLNHVDIKCFLLLLVDKKHALKKNLNLLESMYLIDSHVVR